MKKIFMLIVLLFMAFIQEGNSQSLKQDITTPKYVSTALDTVALNLTSTPVTVTITNATNVSSLICNLSLNDSAKSLDSSKTFIVPPGKSVGVTLSGSHKLYMKALADSVYRQVVVGNGYKLLNYNGSLEDWKIGSLETLLCYAQGFRSDGEFYDLVNRVSFNSPERRKAWIV